MYHSSGIFTTRSTWDIIRTKKDIVFWSHLIWFKNHFLRHTLIPQLAVRGRLMTKDKLLKCKIISNDTCMFCNWKKEDMDHLFFNQEFSMEISNHLMRLCNCRYLTYTWLDYVQFCVKRWKDNSFRNIICKFCLRMIIYFVWRERKTSLSTMEG